MKAKALGGPNAERKSAAKGKAKVKVAGKAKAKVRVTAPGDSSPQSPGSPTGDDVDEDLFRSRRRIRDLSHLQDLRSALLLQHDGMHQQGPLDDLAQSAVRRAPSRSSRGYGKKSGRRPPSWPSFIDCQNSTVEISGWISSKTSPTIRGDRR